MHTLIHQIRARRAMKIAKPRRKPPRQRQPDGIRLEYYQAIKAILTDARKLLAPLFAELPHMLAEPRRDSDTLRTDANDNAARKARAAVDHASKELFERVLKPGELDALAERFAARTSRYQREELGKQAKALLGVDVFTGDRGIAKVVRGFVEDNVSLIKSVPKKYFDDVEKVISRGFREGKRWEEISGELQERLGVAESSANLIARDQIGKLFGELNEVRQKELGADGYIWRTMHDERVRPEHAERDGERFTWEDPPEDGPPGYAINCRCYAEPDFSGVLEAL